MMKRYVMVPVMDSVHVAEGYENVCENCPDWGPKCETCDAFVPTVIDEFRIKEITLAQMDICGIPVGHPYVVKETFIDESRKI